ncbi:MAG: hypothetical protein KDA93_01320 [Planctomycetaceae bacterium]|nr:hypothetical protein [Planctomycetaceae bacterium]
MPSPTYGHRPGDSRVDLDHVDEHVDSSKISWSRILSSPSDEEASEGSARSTAGRDVSVEPTVNDSHVLGGPHGRSRLTGDARDATPHETQSSTGAPSPSASAVSDRRPRLAMILLASYASAVTLACLYLVIAAMQSKSHELENLPDVEPLEANEFRYVPEHAGLPPGHTLPLGRPQQFGHILVEPLRVSYEPLEFVHFSGDEKQTRKASSPVLKLWVRLTNLSDDQQIAPLDPMLLFKRDFDETESQTLTNNLIHSRSSEHPPVHMFDHPLSSEWDLRDQRLGEVLKPGESIVTYLPSEPTRIDQLDRSSLWRIHLRKGFNDSTGHGVTTLVEVEFDPQQVETAIYLTSSAVTRSSIHRRQALP